MRELGGAGKRERPREGARRHVDDDGGKAAEELDGGGLDAVDLVDLLAKDDHDGVADGAHATEEKPERGDALAEALTHDEEGAEDDGREAGHFDGSQARLEDHRAERHHDHGAAVVEQRGHADADVAVRLEEKEPCRAERRAGDVEAGRLTGVLGRLQVFTRGPGKKDSRRERRRAERDAGEHDEDARQIDEARDDAVRAKEEERE